MVSKFPMSGLFAPAKDKRLARIISIKSPESFRKSIRTLMKDKDRLTPKDRKALILAQTRAKVQLNRKNLSAKERREFTIISKMTIPKSNVKTMMMKKRPKKLTGFSIYTGGSLF